MASAAMPRKRLRGRRVLWIIGGVAILAAVLTATFFAFRPQPPAAGTLPEGWQIATAELGTIDSTVSATGNVEAAATANVRFETSGLVTTILVEPGDVVEAGQPLARLDAEGLQLQVEQAQVDLRSVEAEREGLLVGATAAEVAEAQARLEQARRQYQQATASVSPAQIAAARAELEAARARLAELQSGPERDELAAADERVQSAQSTLDQARVDLSAAKERARLDLETRANALRNVQDDYSKIYWENRELERLPGDLPQQRIDLEEQSLRAVRDAEAALETARLALAAAEQDEINRLRQYEASLASAVAARDRLFAAPRNNELASARAEVQRAQASLDQLIGAARASDLAVQESSIAIAQAGLDRVTSEPAVATLAVREAAVARAEVALRTAQRNLSQATLVAPFAATIASVDMRVGEPADASSTIALVELSSFHVEVPVDELDVASVEPGQSVRITLDALPNAEIGGTVTQIAPLATRSDQGTTSYAVTVTLDANSPGVRPGMTAVVQIVTARKEDALLISRRAVRSEGGQSFVLVPTGGAPVATGPGQFAPASERRVVTIGLSNNEFVEILSGLEAGQEVLLQDVVSTFLPGGPPQ
jgi:RND family efflux transporter MFP subunit